MFSEKELNIDPIYFEIINRNCFVVTLRSRNTGHYWHIVNCDETNYYPTCIIYHKHKTEDLYHLHGQRSTLDLCIKSIYSHDAYVLKKNKAKRNKKNGRPHQAI